LLVDLKFQDSDWWNAVRSPVDRVPRSASARSDFPRKSSRSLARSAAVLAWHGVRSDFATACIVLGLAKSVAQLLRDSSLSEMDRIVERGYGVIAPRWLDRPAFWNALLQASVSPSTASTRNVDLHGLQLLAGDST